MKIAHMQPEVSIYSEIVVPGFRNQACSGPSSQSPQNRSVENSLLHSDKPKSALRAQAPAKGFKLLILATSLLPATQGSWFAADCFIVAARCTSPVRFVLFRLQVLACSSGAPMKPFRLPTLPKPLRCSGAKSGLIT